MTVLLAETSSVSGRVVYDNLLLNPVYDARVSVNGKPAKLYGATYLDDGSSVNWLIPLGIIAAIVVVGLWVMKKQ